MSMIDIERRELETGWRDFLQEMTGGRRCIRAAGVSGCVYGNRNPKVCSRGRKGPDLGHSLSLPYLLHIKSETRRKCYLEHKLEYSLSLSTDL